MNNLLSRVCVVFGALLVITLSMSTVTAGANEVPVKKTISIGLYAPFTSNSAFIGRNMLGAMEIARDQLKSSEINYEFYTLDQIPDTTKAANSLQKFIEVHHINVLVTEGSANGAVVAPLAKKNNLIHFSLGSEAVIADGTNNFHALSPNHQRGAILTTAMKPEFVAQFQQEYFSHPVTEAGYAYDIFHLLNNSAVIAMKTNSDFSSKAIASNLLALESGTGLLGSFSMNKNGVAYKMTA